jgi:hypothetical protein
VIESNKIVIVRSKKYRSRGFAAAKLVVFREFPKVWPGMPVA